MVSWNWGIQNEDFLQKTIKQCKEKNIILPKFSEQKNPETIPSIIKSKLSKIDLQEVNQLNIFRINWRNNN